jgi:acyl-CoA synthetase (AMP-forming)/AMP-acid ligase II
MTRLAHVGEVLALYARVVPDKIGASDLERKMTFRLWHSRACRLANAFAGIGLRKGDRVCVLAYNCVEWLELYAAAALAGVVVVPINFRFTGQEARYIIENCEARALMFKMNYSAWSRVSATNYRAHSTISSISVSPLAPRVIAPTRTCSARRATAPHRLRSKAMIRGR